MCPKKMKNPAELEHSDLDHHHNHQKESSDWMEEARKAGSLMQVDLQTGTNGWNSPPGDLFNVRPKNYLTRKQKTPAASDYLLKPAGVDWLRSPGGRLDDVLGRSDNRIMASLRRAQSKGESLKSFVFAVNLQVPGREHHSAVFYFAAEDGIPAGNTLFHRFLNEDDDFRNSRFKIVNRIVRGPWIVRAAVGNYGACLLGRALVCRYVKGPNYMEIDVDIGSSALANAILHLALGYVTAVTIDMGFLVEGQTEEELPERLIGAVRIAQMEMSAAALVIPVAALDRELSSPDLPSSTIPAASAANGIPIRSKLGSSKGMIGGGRSFNKKVKNVEDSTKHQQQQQQLGSKSKLKELPENINGNPEQQQQYTTAN